MAQTLRKPILVGGIGLSVILWLWSNLEDSLTQFGEVSMLGMIALGTGFWFLQRKGNVSLPALPVPSTVDREMAQKAIAAAKSMITTLETEAEDSDISALKQRLAELPEQLDRQTLQIAIAGGKNVGKTQLKQVLEATETIQQQSNLTVIETPAMFTASQEEGTPEIAAKAVAIASDLVLFLVNGDITESEFQVLQTLRASNQRVLLVLNKSDRYLPEERATITGQLKLRSQSILTQEDIMSVAAAPNAVKVRQHQTDGTIKEWMEDAKPEIETLCDRLSSILTQERQNLVWATTWRNAIELKTDAKTELNRIRRDRAIPIIEQYQWVAAAAAFANPVAALDLLATAAINTQMVIDLGAIYQQSFSISQAQTSAGTLGKLMVQLGLVELSTQTVGGILKSNAFTYVAGGVVQGVSAAYLTRLAGLSLIEYFQEQDINEEKGFNLDKLGQKMQLVFQQNQRTAFLQNFAQQVIQRLSLTPPQPQPTE